MNIDFRLSFKKPTTLFKFVTLVVQIWPLETLSVHSCALVTFLSVSVCLWVC